MMTSTPMIDFDGSVSFYEIVCPYCFTQWEDSYELRSDEGEETCESCGNRFAYSRDIEVIYNTERIEEES